MTDQDHRIRRVAVIGTGIAGLGVTACLKQLHTGVDEIVVFDPFEGDHMEYNRGGVLGISGGNVILQKLGCMPDVRKNGNKISEVKLTSGNEKLIDIKLSEFQDSFPHYMLEEGKGDPMMYTLRWSALRQILKDCIANKTPVHMPDVEEEEKSEPHNCKFTFRGGKKFHSLLDDPKTQKVSVFFQDATSEGDFDLVIGADGVKSQVRNYTAKPNQTLVRAIPIIGSFLPFANGPQNTGLRVAQCITPLKPGSTSTSSKVSLKTKEDTTTGENPLNLTNPRCNDDVHQWVGDGSNVITMKVGHGETAHRVLISIYKEEPDSYHEQNPGWAPLNVCKEDITKRLNDSGFEDFHNLYTLLDATTATGSQVYDVGVRDQLFPLRTWASKSGRVILIGDAAHATYVDSSNDFFFC
jgi:2-polyprenyl-6-methoxyphenol hydroxylase-like FAD-dependent oxidoreductase